MQAWYSRWLGSMFTTGSYTFAKTLEYKAKQGLSSGKEVTVIPPIEYQERFVKALDGYFVACPGVSIVSMTIMSQSDFRMRTDKWSHPLDNTKVINDTSLLPCVL
jgi:1-phosphatidylinositol-3-phosphate 5-kinase